MSLFVDIYNTVARFFRPQEELVDNPSKSVATNRLKLVLMQDRTNLTPRILEQMRSELIDLLSRYVELDKELLDLNFEQEGDQVALMLSIPVIRAKDEEEIDAAIKQHNEMLQACKSKNEEEENSPEDSNIADSSEVDEELEEQQGELEKVEAIAQELQEVPKIIKKKEVSTPENIGNNPFKNNSENTEEKVESHSEG